ncbi:MAG: helix-turn-helix transcriptional regulator [Bacteroides sp.]|nr:helix-turn-helix transcriptional regulator [Bacteroides sp.]
MALYNVDSKLSDAIMAHPSLIPVINRLGIVLGVGDKSVGIVCAQAHISSDFFLSVVNTFVDEEYFPINARDAFSIDKTIDYLRKTSTFYCNVQLPNIDRHFNSLIKRSGSDNNLQMLRKFYSGMKEQLEWCLDKEENNIFLAIDEKSEPTDIDAVVRGYGEVEEKLQDLLTFFVVHLRGQYDRNLCMAVVSAVFSLEKDVRQNNRIRNRILLPMLRD